MGLIALMVGMEIALAVGFIPVVRDGHGDFRAFYGAGAVLASGRRDIYNYETEKQFQDRVSPEQIAMPYIHLPDEAVLFAPLAKLKYAKAWIVFTVLNLALLALAGYLLRAHPALLLGFLPVGVAIAQGQDSILLRALLSLAWAAVEKQRGFLAGIFVGLTLFKFQIALPIALLFLLWRNWSFVYGFCASSAAHLVASWALVGNAGMVAYSRTLTQMSAQRDQFQMAVHPTRMANLRGLAAGLDLPPIIVFVLTAVVLIYAWRKQPRFETAILAASLVSYHFLIHDMSILLIPIAIGLKRQSWSALALLGAPLVMAVTHEHFYLAGLVIVAALVCADPTPSPALVQKTQAPPPLEAGADIVI